MHSDLDAISIALLCALPFAAAVAYATPVVMYRFVRWYEDRAFRKANSIADEMWKQAEQGDEEPEPPPRRGVRLVGKDRGEYGR